MTSIQLPLLGQAEFFAEDSPDWWFETECELGQIQIDFHTDLDKNIANFLSTAVPILNDVKSIDAAARTAIRADYANGDPARSFHFLEYHLENYTEDELTECFGRSADDQIGVDQLLATLYLRRIGFYWCDGTLGDEHIVLDYKLANIESDQIIVVYAALDGTVSSVQMES